MLLLSGPKTWYGHDPSLQDTVVKQTATCKDADNAYLRLWRKASWPPHAHTFDAGILGPYVFADIAQALLVVVLIERHVKMAGCC